MQRSRTKAGAAIAVTLSLFVAACGGGDDDGGGGSAADPLTKQISEPSFLAPTSDCYESECSQVLHALYTPIAEVDAESGELDFTNGVGESIETEDGLTYVFTIKEGFTFHNGEPVDAAAYVRAWNYAAFGPNATQTGFFFDKVAGYAEMNPEDPDGPDGPQEAPTPTVEELSGLEATGDYEVTITLSEPFSQWPYVMTYLSTFAPMAQACLDDIDACNEAPIGMGPYQMDGTWEHGAGGGINMVLFEDYSGADVGIEDAISFQIYDSTETAFQDWQAGNVDVIDVVPPVTQAAQDAAGENFIREVDSSYTYLGFPLYVPEFQDPRIRQALSLAIDRELIIDQLLSGEEPAQDVIPPTIPGFEEGACEFCDYDVPRAQQLWNEAGGIPGPVTIWFNSGAGHEGWTEAVGNQWREAFGVEFQLESLDFAPFLEALGNESVTGPYRLAWLYDYPSPENYLDPLYGNGSSNYGGYNNPAFFDALAQGNAQESIEAGLDAYREAADIVLADMPIIPMWFGVYEGIFSDRVTQAPFDPNLGNVDITQAEIG